MAVDMKMLEQLMSKKKDKGDMNPGYKTAKMGVLKDLHSQMGELMAGDVKGLKKVTVAAPDKKSLLDGLSTAKGLLTGSEEESEKEHSAICSNPDACDCPMMEAKEEEESEESEESEDDSMSVEELDSKIKELQMLKAKKSS